MLIADPTEDRGRVGALLPHLQEVLRERGLEHRLNTVREPWAAERAARSALESGDRFLVAVGGDRMVHEVVNALLEDGRMVAPDAVLGVITAGAVNDFARTFGLLAEVPNAVRHLEGDGLFPIDAGKVTVTVRDGSTRVRHFANMAEAGLGGAMAARMERLPHRLGRGRRFLGFWMAAATFRPVSATLQGDRRTWEGRLHDVIVANCQYQHDGMRISPKSWPDDGYLDVLVMTGPKSDSFTIIPKTYLGEHLPHPNIVEYRSKTLRIEASRPLPVHADGEPVGSTPATFEVVPKAIRVKI